MDVDVGFQLISGWAVLQSPPPTHNQHSSSLYEQKWLSKDLSKKYQVDLVLSQRVWTDSVQRVEQSSGLVSVAVVYNVAILYKNKKTFEHLTVNMPHVLI